MLFFNELKYKQNWLFNVAGYLRVNSIIRHLFKSSHDFNEDIFFIFPLSMHFIRMISLMNDD